MSSGSTPPQSAVASTGSLLLRFVLGSGSQDAGSSDGNDALAVRRRIQVALLSAAALSSLATAVGIYGYQHVTRAYRRHSLEDSAKRAAAERKRAERARVLGGAGSSEGAAGSGNQQGSWLARQALLGESGPGTPAAESSPGVSQFLTAPSAADAGEGSSSSAPRYLSQLPSSLPGPEAYRLGGKGLPRAPARKWDEDLLREQLARNYTFLGEEGMAKLRRSYVIVVGAGGVGSWAALMLLRSGVGRIRLIDFDQVSLSSLNRHACATLADVGRPKVLCCADYFAKIAPWAQVEPLVEVFKAEAAAELIDAEADYVVDAIDNIDTKVALLQHCYERNIKVFASMGAAGKADPSRVQISDITDTYEDPLAHSVRRRLRLLGIPPMPPKEEPKKSKRSKLEKLQQRRENKRESQQASREYKEKQRAAQRQQKSEGEGDKQASNAQPVSRPASLEPTSSGSAPMERTSSNSSTGAASRGPKANGDDSLPPATPARPHRYSMGHSRRTSSSSMGSGVYSTPLSTPRLGADEELPFEPLSPAPAVRPLEDVAEDHETSHDGIVLNGSAAASQGAASAEPYRFTAEPDTTVLHLPGAAGMSSQPSRQASELQEMEPESEADKLEILTDGEDDGPEETAEEKLERTRAAYMIPCVYSTEKSDVTLLPLAEDEFQKGNVKELSPLEQFRVRILPVLGPLPAIFGLAAATFIVCDIAGHQMEPLPHKRRRKLYEKVSERPRLLWDELANSHHPPHLITQLHSDLDTNERRYPCERRDDNPARVLPFNLNDIAYMFEDIFAARSVVPPHESIMQGQLLRWDSTLPVSYTNIALFSKDQAKTHIKEVLGQGKSPYAVWARRRLSGSRSAWSASATCESCEKCETVCYKLMLQSALEGCGRRHL